MLLACALPCAASTFGPGMLDLRRQHDNGFDQTNLALWTPVVRGGFGRIAPEAGGNVDYGSVFLNTGRFTGKRLYGVLMYGQVANPYGRIAEAQAEMRLQVAPGDHLGIGVGHADRFGAPVWRYAKIGWRHESNTLGWIAYAIDNVNAGRHSPGFAFAIYNNVWIAGGEWNRERRRLLLGYTAPAGRELRPAVEYFHFDRAPGSIPGPEYLEVSFTLDFTGQGYFSTGSRLGRAIGPAGLQFSNPVGYLLPNWNRRADTWELGRLVNGEYRMYRSAAGGVQRDGEVVAFPFEFGARRSRLDGVFLGPGWRERPGRTSTFPVLGYVLSLRAGACKFEWEGDRSPRATATFQYYIQP